MFTNIKNMLFIPTGFPDSNQVTGLLIVSEGWPPSLLGPPLR